MRALAIAALLAAVPASASNPTFQLGIGCSDTGMPLVIEITAARAGYTTLTLDEMLDFCASREKPAKQPSRVTI
jgi:hypothetical protein